MKQRSLLVMVLLMFTQVAVASLSNNFQFNGKGNWSIDALGSTSAAIGDLRASIPTGSTVEAAFLYQSTNDNAVVPGVTFGSTLLAGSDWTDLGTAAGFLTAFRADVTAQVTATVGSGGITPFTFSVVESNSNLQDGVSLVVVYSNPNEVERTIALLDGFSDPNGDSVNITLSNPLTAAQLADPNFEAQLSLGIGFGFQPSGQFSQVDINGQRLTTSAGGQDDGSANNGALITVGDTFDDDFLNNPIDPFELATSVRTDDEAYNLISFLNAGDTQISIDTLNPSNDDNIFFSGINITAVANVNTNVVPEPGSIFLLSLGLLGFRVMRHKK